jgi:hypothetical protein
MSFVDSLVNSLSAYISYKRPVPIRMGTGLLLSVIPVINRLVYK